MICIKMIMLAPLMAMLYVSIALSFVLAAVVKKVMEA